jgi:plastocyanin
MPVRPRLRGVAVARSLLIFLIAAPLAACSGSSASTPVAPTPTAATPPATTPVATGQPTVAITATGMSPLEITIVAGQRVTFVNNDTRAHDVVGGVDPSHPDCQPEILMFLVPGQAGNTRTFTTARTCEYHDHTQLGVPGFQGRIIIR